MKVQDTHHLPMAAREFRDDPWSIYTQLRQNGAVIRVRMPFLGTTWAATTYEAVREVFKDTELFVRNPTNAGRNNAVPMQ